MQCENAAIYTYVIQVLSPTTVINQEAKSFIPGSRYNMEWTCGATRRSARLYTKPVRMSDKNYDT